MTDPLRDQMSDSIACGACILRGKNAGRRCGRHATAIVIAGWQPGLFVCGVHARAWLPRALARIAYWNPKARAWL